ncbi:hypothetical protein [Variovorax sp.]|jgi:hypothetical protein|nr:hypothetical protein [Variovorax sp.]
MKKLWFALLFLAGGFAQEVRQPTNCQCISTRSATGPSKRKGA